MKPTHVTKGGIKVATKGRPYQGRIRCYRPSGTFHGWLSVARLTALTPVTR